MIVYSDSKTVMRTWTLIESVQEEVGGFGYARIDGDALVWTDVFLVPQSVSKSSVEFDGSGIGAAVERAAQDGVLDNDDFVWVSWHSHHTMKAFWSDTDEECIKTYGAAGIRNLLSFVGNYDHDYEMRIDSFGVEHGGIRIPQVSMKNVRLVNDLRDPLYADVAAELKANVTKITTAPAPSRMMGMTPPSSRMMGMTPPSSRMTGATPALHEELGVTLTEALEIRELMNEHGFSIEEAQELLDGGAVTGPGGMMTLDNWGAIEYDSTEVAS